MLLGEGLSTLHLRTQVEQYALARAWRPTGALNNSRALRLLLGRWGRRRFCPLRQQEVRRQLRTVSRLRGVRDPSLRAYQTPGLRGRGDPRRPGGRWGRGQSEDAVLQAQQQVLVVNGDCACEGRGRAQAWSGNRGQGRDWGGDSRQAAGAQRRAALGVRAAFAPQEPWAQPGLLPPHGPCGLASARSI